MTIPASASKANIRMSIKKYLTDTLETARGKHLSFDQGFLLPEIDGLTEWFSVNFGDFSRTGLSHILVELICATRSDPDGDRLAELSDIAFDVMTDVDSVTGQVDGKRRIDFFDVSADPWVPIGKLLVRDVLDSPEMPGPDNTKYQLLTCHLSWVAKA